MMLLCSKHRKIEKDIEPEPPKLYDAEIEYLESIGTQYIDCLVNGNNNSTVEVDFAYNGNSVTGLFGAGKISGATVNNSFYIYTISSNIVQIGYNKAFVNFSNYYPNTRSVIRLERNALYKNGTKLGDIGTNTDFTTATSILLFSAHVGADGQSVDSRMFTGKIYYCKIWDNEILVRDFIPVRAGETGYMYDKVSGELFGNVGTGEFILGPDVE